MLDGLNSKQRSTLESLFEDPVRSDISWKDVESLLKALGAFVREGKGSRVRVVLNGVKAVFHEPHPQPEISKYTVRNLRDFFLNAGITLD